MVDLEKYGEGCRSKAQYPTRAKAQKMKKIRTKASGIQMSVYKCRGCEFYHLTSQERKPIYLRKILNDDRKVV